MRLCGQVDLVSGRRRGCRGCCRVLLAETHKKTLAQINCPDCRLPLIQFWVQLVAEVDCWRQPIVVVVVALTVLMVAVVVVVVV